MPPDSVVPLFDADNDIMYIKSTDGAGFPTIRAFAFQPIENKPEPARQYVTEQTQKVLDTITGNRMADMRVIVPMQHELHEKYKKKLHDIGKKLSWGEWKWCRLRPSKRRSSTWRSAIRLMPYVRGSHGCTSSATTSKKPTVDYAALMGIPDKHMECIKAVCPKEYGVVM